MNILALCRQDYFCYNFTTREMFHKIHKFLFLILCACVVGTGCYADDVSDIIRDSKRLSSAQQGDKSAEIFDDIDYLKSLLESFDWANSSDPQRRELYKKLENTVREIEDAETDTDQDALDEKRADAKAAKEREQSTANKLLGGATMGAMGLGGMELASALSEKQVMEDAEQTMKAYLATFTCRYSDGGIVQGGEVDIELPGGNELLPLVTEYKQLAADLKARKQALDIAPGIETEEIIDKANSGLYNDESTGIIDGVYTSVSRALQNENSEDAKEWAADKEAIDKKIKTSTTVVAVTAVASIAANLAINNKKKTEVASRADTTRKEVRNILDEIIKNCNAEIEASDSDNVHLLTGYEDLGELEGHPICK
jgi:hypothetical protein